MDVVVVDGKYSGGTLPSYVMPGMSQRRGSPFGNVISYLRGIGSGTMHIATLVRGGVKRGFFDAENSRGLRGAVDCETLRSR